MKPAHAAGALALAWLLLAPPAVAAPPAGASDHLSVRDFGAVCDGQTDDTAALTRAFSSGNYRIELPASTCAFAKAPLKLDRPFGAVVGAGMWGTSRLLYTGANTRTDLLQVGSGATAPTGLTSTGYSVLRDFTVESATKMTGGFAVHEMGTQFILFQNIALGRQQDPVNLWGGFYFDQIDYTHVDQFFITAQDDCLAVSGHGAEGHPATGPQYDLWIDNGKISGCHIGVHVGGGFDGAFFDHVMDTANDYDVVVDTSLSPHPNQEVNFGAQFFADFASWDSVLIDDALCEQRIYCSATFAGPIVHSENAAGIASGSHAGAPPPPDSGHGIHIKHYSGGYVLVHSPYLQFHPRAAIFTEDVSAYLSVSPATLVTRNGGGIHADKTWPRVMSLPRFLANGGPDLVNIPVEACAGKGSCK